MRHIWWVLVLLLGMPVVAQESQDEKRARIRERVSAILDEADQKLRRDLARLVRDELAGEKEVEPVPDGASFGSISEEGLKKHLTFLASDDLKGRQAGYPGNNIAADYIQKHFKEAGLKPLGKDGSYFQPFQIQGRETQNVVGLREGTDEVLKKEIVVVGAHYDHVGMSGEGAHRGRMFTDKAKEGDKIWNGADDNGSGSSALLSLVQAFAAGKIQTKRSILFLAFSGEEGGLVGSRHYVSHPSFAIPDHVFMLNLDMVGRNPDKPVQIQGVGSDDTGLIRKICEAAVKDTGLNTRIRNRVVLTGGSSDHASFDGAKIPFAFFFTGFHSDYHRVTDHADKIDYANLKLIARTAGGILVRVGNAKKRPQYKDGQGGIRIPPIPQGGAPRRLLGVRVDRLTDEDAKGLKLGDKEGGIRLTSVSPDSVAEKGGLREGDIVLSWNGTAFSREDPLGDLRDKIEEVKAGQEVELGIDRDGERMKQKVKWEK